MKKRALCISSLDLEYFKFGGVSTLAHLFAEIAKESGFDPFYLTPAVNLHRTIRRTLKGQFPPSFVEITHQGSRCIQMAAQWPEFEFNAHDFDRAALESHLENVAGYFAVSGNNQACLPFSQLQRPFSMWIASTFWEDSRHRIESSPWSLRKFLDLATRSGCEKLERKLFIEARQTATITNYTQKLVRKVAPEIESKLRTLLIPVCCKRFHPSENPQRKDILFIGRLNDPRKNLDLLLQAFEKYAFQSSVHDLVLIGSSDAETEAKIRNHPLTARIRRWQGISESEKISRIQNSFLLAIPSIQEGYGITGAEAMACGIPVVSTACGGTSDFILHGETGFILENFSPLEMAEQFLNLEKDPAMHSRMSAAARAHSLTLLDLKVIKPQLQAFLYQGLA